MSRDSNANYIVRLLTEKTSRLINSILALLVKEVIFAAPHNANRHELLVMTHSTVAVLVSSVAVSDDTFHRSCPSVICSC